MGGLWITLFVYLGALSIIWAQENPITAPTAGQVIQAGTNFEIKWTPKAGGTVSIDLWLGNAAVLQHIASIASNIPNSGSYQWSIASSIGPGTGYKVDVSSNSSDSNYSGVFTIKAAAPVSSPTTPPTTSVHSSTSTWDSSSPTSPTPATSATDDNSSPANSQTDSTSPSMTTFQSVMTTVEVIGSSTLTITTSFSTSATISGSSLASQMSGGSASASGSNIGPIVGGVVGGVVVITLIVIVLFIAYRRGQKSMQVSPDPPAQPDELQSGNLGWSEQTGKVDTLEPVSPQGGGLRYLNEERVGTARGDYGGNR